VNDVPVAANDVYTMTQNDAGDASLTIGAPGLLENDSDADGQPLEAAKLSDPVHGTVTVNEDGSFTYTPEAGYTGPDSFTYQAFDGTDDSEPATVTITVQPPTGGLPVVESVVIEDDSAQRAMVTMLTITFNTVVEIAGDFTDVFLLEDKNSGTPITGWTLTDASSATKTVLEMQFPAANGFAGGSLDDGNYLLTILAEGVTAAGQTLDGDGDGEAGGDHRFGAEDEFFRWFGDSNGDRYVDGFDLGVFRGTYGKTSDEPGYLWYFDYDADGDVDQDDYAAFVARYRTRYLTP
jgi:VCBS repeat-containing protein